LKYDRAFVNRTNKFCGHKMREILVGLKKYYLLNSELVKCISIIFITVHYRTIKYTITTIAQALKFTLSHITN
jgi:hypothetical protein